LTDIKNTGNPIPRAWIITDIGTAECNIRRVETPASFLPYRILAHAKRVVGGEAAIWRAVPIGPSIVGPSAVVVGPSPIVVAAHTGPASLVTAASPRQVERVSFRAAGRIADPDHGTPAVSRIANQFLLAAAVDPVKPEVDWIRRHGSGAFKPAPLRRLPREIP
jgi:hypothetical protein